MFLWKPTMEFGVVIRAGLVAVASKMFSEPSGGGSGRSRLPMEIDPLPPTKTPGTARRPPRRYTNLTLKIQQTSGDAKQTSRHHRRRHRRRRITKGTTLSSSSPSPPSWSIFNDILWRTASPCFPVQRPRCSGDGGDKCRQLFLARRTAMRSSRSRLLLTRSVSTFFF